MFTWYSAPMVKVNTKLRDKQWDIISKYCANLSQAITLFALSAIFIPDILNLKHEITFEKGFFALVWGMMLLVLSVIMKGIKK